MSHYLVAVRFMRQAWFFQVAVISPVNEAIVVIVEAHAKSAMLFTCMVRASVGQAEKRVWRGGGGGGGGGGCGCAVKVPQIDSPSQLLAVDTILQHLPYLCT